MALDPRIEIIREKYGLDKADFWELPQKKGTWLVKHAALEVAAAQAGIVFDNPLIIEASSADGVAVISVRGELPPEPTKARGQSEWSIGEASPKNNKNAYPWAMAEKRAKDRVILKLIGIHGLVYSEDEMPDADERPPRQDSAPAPRQQRSRHDAEEPAEMSNTAGKAHWKTIYDEMASCTTLKQLQGAWNRHYRVYEQLPDNLQTELRVQKDEMKDRLMAAEEQEIAEATEESRRLHRQAGITPPNFDNLGAPQ